MILRIDAGGRTRAVDVTGSGDRFLVSIDGRQHEVDVSNVGGVSSLLIGTRSHEVAVYGSADGAMVVHVDGVPVELFIERPTWAAASSHGPTAHAGGPQQVTAPMPGKIVKVLVKPGDHVEPRQGLVVVEAMKMENELRARAAGTVTEVRAAEGTTVEAGAILIVLE